MRSDLKLCENIIALVNPTLISLCIWDCQREGLLFKGDQLTYFYCVSKYPTKLAEVEMPIFQPDQFLRHNDHTMAWRSAYMPSATKKLTSEKHFAPNKAAYFPTETGRRGPIDTDDLCQPRCYADNLTIVHGITPAEK